MKRSFFFYGFKLVYYYGHSFNSKLFIAVNLKIQQSVHTIKPLKYNLFGPIRYLRIYIFQTVCKYNYMKRLIMLLKNISFSNINL